MSGPFTTITVNQYHRMQDTIRAADELARAIGNDKVLAGYLSEEVLDALATYEKSRREN